MKIIAQIDKGTVLCEVTSGEIARLHGNDGNAYSRDFNPRWLEVGSEHDLSKAIDTLAVLRKFDEKELKNLKYQIDDATETYERILDQYQKVMLFDTLKNIKKDQENGWQIKILVV